MRTTGFSCGRCTRHPRPSCRTWVCGPAASERQGASRRFFRIRERQGASRRFGRGNVHPNATGGYRHAAHAAIPRKGGWKKYVGSHHSLMVDSLCSTVIRVRRLPSLAICLSSDNAGWLIWAIGFDEPGILHKHFGVIFLQQREPRGRHWREDGAREPRSGAIVSVGFAETQCFSCNGPLP